MVRAEFGVSIAPVNSNQSDDVPAPTGVKQIATPISVVVVATGKAEVYRTQPLLKFMVAVSVVAPVQLDPVRAVLMV